jgi:flagellar protein FliS
MGRTERGITAYRTAILTTPPRHAVVMLYDGIMVRTRRAAEAARAGDYETQFNEVLSAAKIIDGLNRCLDMEQGGQVAVSLRAMYEAVSKALLRSTGKRNGAEILDGLVEAVRLTRDAWAEIAGVPASEPSRRIRN